MADAPIIDIVNLEKRYRSKNTDVFALQGINLAINKGDIFGVIGKSGAGKSTLVRCINMLERPTGGSIFFEGKDRLVFIYQGKKHQIVAKPNGMYSWTIDEAEQTNAPRIPTSTDFTDEEIWNRF